MRAELRLMGSPQRWHSICFQTVCDLLVSPSARALLQSRAHPSLSLLLFRAPSPSRLARTFRLVLHLPGFLSSSRHHSCAFTYRKDAPVLTTFRPQAFSASRRLSPRSSLQAYFIPQPRPGSRSFKDFSLCTATLPHRKEHAPLSLFLGALTDRDRLPHAQVLDFEASIRAKIRSDG